MEEVRKRRYPTNRAKLYELRDRLEQEIAESQAALNDVRRLIREADNAAIINTARANNVTPEDFVELIGFSRLGSNEQRNNNGYYIYNTTQNGTVNFYYTRDTYKLTFMSNYPVDAGLDPANQEITGIP